MIKSVFLCAMLIFLTACGQPKYANVTMRPAEIDKEKMSLIVLKIIIPFKDLFDKTQYHDGYAELIKSKDHQNKTKIYRIDGHSYLSSATMITPGEYHVRLIGWSDGLNTYTVKAFPSKINVKPGACVYVGDIMVLHHGDAKNTVFIRNNIDDAIADIKSSKLKTLAEKLHFVAPFRIISSLQGDTILK